jgi:Zn-dependent protease
MDIDRLRDVTPKGYKFSTIELRDLLISVIVLSLAFLIMFRSASFTAYFEEHLGGLWAVGMLGMMVGIVALSFVAHELGHKFTAQRFGLWSEYRMFPMGLLLTLLMSFVGFLIAAPGVVYIKGFVDVEQDGKISVAGPAVNIVLALIGLAGCIAFNHSPVVIFFYLLFILNASLALFNLLPIGILDGAKVLRWNSSVWVLCIAIAGVLFVSRLTGMLPDFYYG